MALNLDHIKAPIAEELVLFEQKFRESMKSHTPLLDAITRYIVKSKGKQVRPMFVFLSAKMFGGGYGNHLPRRCAYRITSYCHTGS
jgi:octaprenyl-diphosphate synthase